MAAIKAGGRPLTLAFRPPASEPTALAVGFGRIVVSETEAPNFLVSLLSSGRAVAQSDNAGEPQAVAPGAALVPVTAVFRDAGPLGLKFQQVRARPPC